MPRVKLGSYLAAQRVSRWSNRWTSEYGTGENKKKYKQEAETYNNLPSACWQVEWPLDTIEASSSTSWSTPQPLLIGIYLLANAYSQLPMCTTFFFYLFLIHPISMELEDEPGIIGPPISALRRYPFDIPYSACREFTLCLACVCVSV